MKIIIFFSYIYIIFSHKLKQEDDSKKRKITKGDNIGTNLYNSDVVLQVMKRPQKWFFNIMTSKPTEKYFREAEYDGLRYQTEMLRDNLDREYNSYIKDYYDEKLNVYEQKMLNNARAYFTFKKYEKKPKKSF